MRCPHRPADLPHRPTPIRYGRLLAVLIAVAAPALATAQPAGPCTASLAAAETLYRGQDFVTAEALLRECLGRLGLDEATSLWALRLLVLVTLQEGNIAEARQTVVRILNRSPDYRPDPIQDPPIYVSLVETVQKQLRSAPVPEVERPEDAVVTADVGIPGEEASVDVGETSPPDDPPEIEAPPPIPALPPTEPRRYRNPFRRAGTSEISLVLGIGSYRGEFSTDGNGPLSDFFENSGITLEVQTGYTLSSTLAAVFSYRLFELPELVRASASETRAGGTSVHTFALLSRLQLRPRSSDSPYVQLGLAGVLSGGTDQTRFGIGPQVGLGLDVVLTHTLALFATIDSVFLYPGDVLDQTGARGDLLFFTGVGVRYRMPG